MTYQEALKNALDKFTTNPIDFVDLNGNNIHQDSMEVLPITFAEFLTNMAAVLVMVANNLFSVDICDMYMGKEKVTDGKAKALPTLQDCMQVLTGNDLGRSMMLRLQTNQFVEWLLEQKAENDDIENMWCDFDALANKWNKHAQIRMGE